MRRPPNRIWQIQEDSLSLEMQNSCCSVDRARVPGKDLHSVSPQCSEANDRPLPPVTALSMNGDRERERFTSEYGPAYPVVQIKEDLFWRLLGMAELPRFFLLREGRVLKVWNERAPSVEAVEKALGALGHP